MLNRYDLVESIGKRLSNAVLGAMIPLYVKGTPARDDHKCGNCSMFVADESACTIVKGDISGQNGTCNYWAPLKGGKPPGRDKIHGTRTGFKNAGYVEVPAGVKVNCQTCEYFGEPNRCRLWQGEVAPYDCCMAWDSPRAITPKE